MAETRSASEEGLAFQTTDYRIRLMEAPDGLIEGRTKTVYAIFNRHTDVREGVTDNLAYAIATVVTAQTMLEQTLANAKQGKDLASAPPAPNGPMFPSQLN